MQIIYQKIKTWYSNTIDKYRSWKIERRWEKVKAYYESVIDKDC